MLRTYITILVGSLDKYKYSIYIFSFLGKSYEIITVNIFSKVDEVICLDMLKIIGNQNSKIISTSLFCLAHISFLLKNKFNLMNDCE